MWIYCYCSYGWRGVASGVVDVETKSRYVRIIPDTICVASPQSQDQWIHLYFSFYLYPAAYRGNYISMLLHRRSYIALYSAVGLGSLLVEVFITVALATIWPVPRWIVIFRKLKDTDDNRVIFRCLPPLIIIWRIIALIICLLNIFCDI